jgi:hypothetical protein
MKPKEEAYTPASLPLVSASGKELLPSDCLSYSGRSWDKRLHWGPTGMSKTFRLSTSVFEDGVIQTWWHIRIHFGLFSLSSSGGTILMRLGSVFTVQQYP